MNRKWTLYVVWCVAFTLVGNPALRAIPGRLGQDTVVGWLTDNFPHVFGLPVARSSKLFSTAWEFGVPLLIAILLLLCARLVRLTQTNQ